MALQITVADAVWKKDQMNRSRFIQGLKSDIQLSDKERRRIIRKSLQKYPWKLKCTVAMEEFAELQQQIWDSLFEQIEEALGFRLFFWQKTYIMGLGYRHSGQTTADVLRNLVGECISEPIYLKRPKNHMEDFYQHELIEIKRKLDDKGVISRSIERRK